MNIEKLITTDLQTLISTNNYEGLVEMQKLIKQKLDDINELTHEVKQLRERNPVVTKTYKLNFLEFNNTYFGHTELSPEELYTLRYMLLSQNLITKNGFRQMMYRYYPNVTLPKIITEQLQREHYFYTTNIYQDSLETAVFNYSEAELINQSKFIALEFQKI